MKKRFIAMAVAAMTLGGVMSAQTPETTTDNTTTATTCQQDQKCGKKDCKGKKHDGRRQGRNKQGQASLFEGIELTADQQKAIEALRQENRASREQAQKDAQAGREAKRQAFNDNLKNILTPEQYAKYEQNVAAANAKRENAGKQRGEVTKARHDMRRGNRAGKRQAAAANQAQATATSAAAATE